MTEPRFEVITRDYPLNKRKGFDNLENAYTYWKKLPKRIRKWSHIWYGLELLL